MNNRYSKVNTRCIILSAFVLVSYLILTIPVFAQEPTRNPTEAEQLRRRLLHDELEAERDKYVQTGLTYDQIQRQSQKEIWSILGRLFSGVGQTNVTPSPGYVAPPGSTPLSSQIQSLMPPGDIPAGRCSTLADQAMVNLGNHPSNIDTYIKASQATGVAWEVVAAIHYIEASSRPNGSCISGRAIGEPEPDRGGKRYSSLLETCIEAANLYKTDKKNWALDFIKNNNLPTPTELQMMIAQFTAFNSVTQGECETEYTNDAWRYTGRIWAGSNGVVIPDKGQCSSGGRKGEKYMGDRHVYGSYCMDSEHDDMYFHFHYDKRNVKYDSHVGAIAFIKALQKVYKNLVPTGSVQQTISYQPPTGNFVYYNQCDPNFQNSSWGVCGRNNAPLNCYAGCGPTSAAEIIATYANASYTPIQAMSKATGWGAVNCGGSGIGTLYRLMAEYSDKIEAGLWIGASGDFYQDARQMKPYIDQGWTVLAAASYTPCCGHWAWIVDVDENYNVWSNDVYWFQSKYVGTDARAPMNLTSFINGGYPYKGVTNINVTGFTVVGKKK